MTCVVVSAAQGAFVTVDAETQGLRHSEAAGRGIPHGGAHTQPWTREGHPFLRHPREAGIPYGGRGSTVLFLRQNRPGDSSVADGSL